MIHSYHGRYIRTRWTLVHLNHEITTYLKALDMAHEDKEHVFVHPELQPDVTPNFQPCLRVSCFFNKKESITYEEFFAHWQTIHADLAVATKEFSEVILRYTQVITHYFVPIG